MHQATHMMMCVSPFPFQGAAASALSVDNSSAAASGAKAPPAPTANGHKRKRIEGESSLVGLFTHVLVHCRRFQGSHGGLCALEI